MKKHFLQFMSLLCIVAFAACSNDLNPGFDAGDYEPILPPEPVHTLTSMASGERVVLSGESVEDIVLSWIPTEVKGNTVFRYEVLFDTIGGDFTNPIGVNRSDLEALSTKLTLSHTQMNAIGKLAKFKANSNGTLRWRIRAYCGLDQAISSLEGHFTIFMMDGIDDIPGENDNLYITGLATEDGGDASIAQKMTMTGEGIYQVFLKMKKDKTYIFMSIIDGETHYYYYSKDKLRQRLNSESNECTSPKDGIFRITVNFNTQEYAIVEVTSVYLFYGISSYTQKFNYLGSGKWGVKNYTAHKSWADWAKSGETRYNYRMELLTDEGSTQIKWGHSGKDVGDVSRDDAGNIKDYSYFNLYATDNSDPWDYSFRYDSGLLNWGSEAGGKWEATVKTDVILYFNADYGVYTQRWTVAN